MTDEQLNVICAEAEGWIISKTHEYTLYGLRAIGELPQFETRCAAFENDGVMSDLNSLPSYGTDLNAMHRLEEVLDDKQLVRYAAWLEVITSSSVTMIEHVATNFFQLAKVARADAHQRREAFVRTIGKWEE